VIDREDDAQAVRGDVVLPDDGQIPAAAGEPEGCVELDRFAAAVGRGAKEPRE